MRKITLLLLTILPILVFGQTTIESFSFNTDAEGFVPGNASDTSVNFDATNYYSSSGAIEMQQLTINKVIKKTGITSIDALGEYTLKFKVKGVETGANIKGNLRTTTNYAGIPITMNTLPSSTGDDGATWYEYSTTITIATLNLTNSQIQIQTNTLGTYYIDDVEIIKEPIAGNILTIDVVGGGTVSANPDQVSYTDGTTVQLTANPATHWTFDSWSGDLTGSTNPDDITMDADKTVTANFVLDPLFDYDFTFDTDGELEGWEPDASLGVSGPSSGILTLTTQADSWSRFNLYNFPIPAAAEGENDPNKYNKLDITLQNPSATTDQIGLVVEGSTTVYSLNTGDTGFQTYTFDLTAIPAWTGDITSFRIRFADADNPSAAGRPSEAHDIFINSITFGFDAALNTQDFMLEGFAMYPNPANNTLNIESPSRVETVEIFDITGKQVLTNNGFENTIKLNVSGLNSGLYLVKLTDVNKNSAIKKLILK